MAINIIPGYDFGVNEVPNRETLLRQARYMKISGIGLDQIDASLVGYKSGTTSGTTSSSLPAPGWMWADPGGSLWIETDHGPVKLHRDGGGFESVRYGQSYSPESSPPWPGSPYRPDAADAIATQTEGINLGAPASECISLWDELFTDANNGANSESIMWSAETMPSGTTYPRLVGRGLTLGRVIGSASHFDFCCRVPAGMRVIGTNNAWSGAFVVQASNVIGASNKEAWYGIFVCPHSGTSLVGNATRITMHGDCYGWKYDQVVFGPGAAV